MSASGLLLLVGRQTVHETANYGRYIGISHDVHPHVAG
jgi:hypothetical protein